MSYFTCTARFRKLDVGEGFIVVVEEPIVELLRSKGLLGQGVLHFANRLADLTAEKESLPEEEWKAYESAMSSLTVGYDGGELYRFLLHSHGPDTINFNLWARLSLDSCCPICVRTFTQMPTEVLEEYGKKVWHQERRRSCGKSGRKEIYDAIGQRSDIYGAHSMPIKLAVGLLFDEGEDEF